MLSIGKLAADARVGRYYIEQVASGREDYYAGSGEAPGAWVGEGARLLGANGEVTADGLTRILGASHPETGQPLRRPLKAGAVAGFDLTFRAPKSVGLLFGIGDEALSQDMRAAHAAAIWEAIRYLERNACGARRGKGGRVPVRGEGFVAAAFEHRSSRAGDPLLHTHVVVANMTRGPDGRWTALDGRQLYAHGKTAGFVYQAVLRAEIGERLGLHFGPVENGTADIHGVPRRVIEHFSRRRAEVLALMEARGESSARAAQVATLETRRCKEYGVPVSRLREQWRARAAEHGLGEYALARLTRGGAPVGVAADDRDLLLGLTQTQATFERRDVVQACAAASRDVATASAIEARADRVLERDDVVRVSTSEAEPRFSTAGLLQLEGDLIAGSRRRQGTGVAVALTDRVDAALAAAPVLGDEQRDLVIALTTSGDGVEVVRAAAGTGKTTALSAARQAWRSSGVQVLGCALSARAACELRDGAAIDSTTIASLKLGGIPLPLGSVLIVDEAGMVGTRDLAALAAAAERANAKLVLVGDDRQLPEIDAGGAFRGLAETLGSTELHEVHRQREQWDRDALAELRDGEVGSFARAYLDQGRIVATASGEDAQRAVVEDWFAADQRGDDAVMIAHRRADVADLNIQARELLRRAGRIGQDEITTDRAGFAIGDRVVTTRNDRKLRAVNGQAGTLVAIGEGVDVRLDCGATVSLTHEYVRAGHLQHAYAMTAHRAQGATVDRAFVLGSDELYREWGYTALSRHRIEARFYIAARPEFLNREANPLATDAQVTERAAGILSTRRAQRLASADREHDLKRAVDPLRVLRRRRERSTSGGIER